MPYFVVIREHSAFMDALTETGFILAGSPDEATVRRRLGSDPWGEDMLRLASVEAWTVLLGGFGAAR